MMWLNYLEIEELRKAKLFWLKGNHCELEDEKQFKNNANLNNAYSYSKIKMVS